MSLSTVRNAPVDTREEMARGGVDWRWAGCQTWTLAFTCAGSLNSVMSA